jgi:hypothetical protein
MTFREVKIGTTFYRGGTFWKKRSSRTATIVENGKPTAAWYYWRLNDRIDHLCATCS